MNHAIHPALIPFPFAFLIGAVAFDLAGRFLERPALWTTGGHLAVVGIVAALVAAVPGIIDYVYTVPPTSTGKSRAARHGIANIAAIALIGAARFIRGDAADPPPAISLVLQVAGAGVLCYAGWLGGTLVSRNLISVDHRYADAGKWKEKSVTGKKGEEVTVASAGELEAGQMQLLRVNGKRIALARTPEGYVAIADRCTHRGGSLAGGVLIDGIVQCLWHGSQFECATGKVHCGPAKRPVEVFEVRSQGKVVKLVI